jgi:hypothetical protein
MTDELEDDYAQGVWRSVEATARKFGGRKDGKAPHEFIDVSALRRLIKILERPVAERLGDGKGE